MSHGPLYKAYYDAVYEVLYGEFQRTIYDTLYARRVGAGFAGVISDLHPDVVVQMKRVQKARNEVLDARKKVKQVMDTCATAGAERTLVAVAKVDSKIGKLKDAEFDLAHTAAECLVVEVS